MRISFVIMTLSCLLVVGCGLTDERISPSGPVSVEVREGTGFTEVEVSDGFDVEIRQGAEAAVAIETHENIHPLIEVDAFGNRLRVFLRNGFRLRNGGAVKVLVTVPELTEFDGNGAVDATLVDPLDQENFHYDLTGASSLRGEVTVTNLTARLTGASEADLVGSAATYRLEVKGASEVEDFGLVVNELNVELTGASSIDVTVNESLSVDASGASVVNFMGDGIIVTQNLSGASEVNRR